jgi:leucyl-tRNA synthetase
MWLPVDYYIGGKEHAVGHLLYSRFVTQALCDAGLLKLKKKDHEGQLPDLEDEPFRRLFNQGIVYKGGAKMSKSKGNVVSADDLAEQYGADTARLFAFFGGPADQDLEWTTSGVEGCHRFLKRVWRLAHSVSGSKDTMESCGDVCREAVRARHHAVAGVTEDITNWRFNTAIAKLMEYLNKLEDLWQQADQTDESQSFRNAILTLAQLIGPFAPHIAEELWQQLGGMGLCCESDWPIYDPQMLVEATVELPVQINGKVRGRITVPTEASEADVFAAAEGDAKVSQWLEGKQLVKKIYVPGRMVTLVVK